MRLSWLRVETSLPFTMIAQNLKPEYGSSQAAKPLKVSHLLKLQLTCSLGCLPVSLYKDRFAFTLDSVVHRLRHNYINSLL